MSAHDFYQTLNRAPFCMGQVAFRILQELAPGFAASVRGTSLDPQTDPRNIPFLVQTAQMAGVLR